MATLDVLKTVVREAESGRSAVLCAIVATRGSTPQPAGTLVCVGQDARLTGTLGGGCVEADIRRQAYQLLSHPDGELEYGRLITVTLDHDFGYDDGMICGGQMDVAAILISPSSKLGMYRETIELLREGQEGLLHLRVDTSHGLVEYRVHIAAEPRLVIAGAGHISRILAGMMVTLGFGVHVIDERAEYANADRFPDPIRIAVGDIAGTLKRLAVDGNTYIVIVTRGHKHDEDALAAVLGAQLKYVGMIGSRRKVAVVLNDLREAGGSEDQIARVHAPIGLNINSVTAEEIALSIAAELVSVRRRDHSGVVEGPIVVG